MAIRRKKRDTPEAQSARFKETARALGADERPEEFARLLKTVAPKKKPSK